MGQLTREVGMVGGTVVPVGGTFSLQAGIINICKPYANHPEERHNTGGMSKETLEMIQPTPPPFTGEKRGLTRKGLAQGHLDMWALRKDASEVSTQSRAPSLTALSFIWGFTRWQRGCGV